MSYEFTSESVSEGHPDKIADLISDSIADFLIEKNPNNRAAIETLVTSNTVVVAGEYKSDTPMSMKTRFRIEGIIRRVVREIGYEQENFHWDTLDVVNLIHGQSPDIALGTDDFGAGDQGLMFGYACTETEDFMPSAIYHSHNILQLLTEERKSGRAEYLGPDAKAQVTMEYNDDGTPLRISKVVCSSQHTEDYPFDIIRTFITQIVKRAITGYFDEDTEFLINPTGRFIIGGPDGDTGVTGRKIIVDTYGGYAPHGGGAFSGKDCTKVDRSGAYMARYLAKNIVASTFADTCTVQLSYAIGVKEPTSLHVFADGKVRNDLAALIREKVDLTPKGIIDKFDLFMLQLELTTNYGHFGKADLPWERLDLDLGE